MAALSRVSKWKDLNDVKVYPLTADPAGGSPTYGTGVDIPGILRLNISPDVAEQKLLGDGKVLATDTKITSMAVDFEHSKVSLDAAKIMIGGTVTDTGTTPNQKTTFAHKGADVGQEFKLEGKISSPDLGIGSITLILYRIKIGKYTLGAQDSNGGYVTISASGTAMALLSNDNMFDIVENETAADLST